MSTISTTNKMAPGTQAMNTPVTTAGASGGGGMLANEKDAKEAQTAAKFGDVLQNIQAKYGAKAEKPREIKKTLGKDDFLRIMITQMRHQDPTNPFKAEQMATEMAQFTSVEQMQNMNQGMNKLVTANQPLERLAMTNLIGKTVTVDRNRFIHAEGQNESLSFNLPRDASVVKVQVVSDTGETILEKEIGSHKAGEGMFGWDGLKANTLPAKSGNYMFRIEAKDDNGQSIHTDAQKRARVVGVSFEGAEAVALVGDAQHQDKIGIKNLVRIESDDSAPVFAGPAAGAGGARPAAPAPAPAAAAPPVGGSNFISFTPGVGSANAESGQMSPEAAAALAKYQQAQGGGAKAAASAPAAPQAPNAAPAGAEAGPGAAQVQGAPQAQAQPQLQPADMAGGPDVAAIMAKARAAIERESGASPSEAADILRARTSAPAGEERGFPNGINQ